MIDVDDIPESLRPVRDVLARWRDELSPSVRAHAVLVHTQCAMAIGHLVDTVGQDRAVEYLRACTSATEAHDFTQGCPLS